MVSRFRKYKLPQKSRGRRKILTWLFTPQMRVGFVSKFVTKRRRHHLDHSKNHYHTPTVTSENLLDIRDIMPKYPARYRIVLPKIHSRICMFHGKCFAYSP